MAFKNKTAKQDQEFDKITISLCSPDDIQGRAKTYEAIVKGDNLPNPGIPESFNVLIHELRGLALDLDFD